ncbi:hypothetical protein [Rhizobium sp. FKY42]|uniref:hypothetical protein n=1 Tax=Rhizobium sp. FKY42 TaxID=2562310 RepID=UPI0010C02FE3|nr:hypothetical protein [Rhizobium sp. FKY42]
MSEDAEQGDRRLGPNEPLELFDPFGAVERLILDALRPFIGRPINAELCEEMVQALINVCQAPHGVGEREIAGQKDGAHCLGFAVEDIIWRGQRASIVDQNFPIGTPITSAHASRRPDDQLAERHRRIGEMVINLLGLAESASDPGVDFGQVLTQEIEKLKAQPHIAGWIFEDELPESYPYDAMYPYSKVDGVRLFPVFAPVHLPQASQGLTNAEGKP